MYNNDFLQQERQPYFYKNYFLKQSTLHENFVYFLTGILMKYTVHMYCILLHGTVH